MIATKYNINKLRKKVDKLYYGCDQKLYINTYELREDACSLDVGIFIDGHMKQYLFEIITPVMFTDSFAINVQDNKMIWAETRNGEESYHPYYFDRTFFLNKKVITDEDIYNCVRYFTRKVLGCFMTWNIEILKQEEE